MKDQVNLQTAGYNRSIDKTINHISKELTQQEGNINRKLTEDVNESVSIFLLFYLLSFSDFAHSSTKILIFFY